ncbi:MAG: hypothetical protein FP825_06515 [Hyphomonas sp.]|uniref:Mov34/MPN/PAD-1 family protein n=1 Tax=Hyphomonas sp. TaxID=87 RepID=UPI00182AC06A|nr:Mov34/MPN/PAD-1 family protein [Hyphomonas sp.]MBA3068113.1 hypothetical protein [Hyphomonas sp.]MBU3922438.1 Mov34/MPN/PAD-1 family protein [Alphaproteobacteria bacterium]MBU4061461.1 Mov34/MPN/PAD-1 family protein [Alphaproteobacteria bacterium]MBU4165029.1 Mov34/MPN/PAD-1 family protein [Alphaproteobacteria bacterium]
MQIELPKQQIARFKSLLKKAGRREIGGVLMAEQINQGIFRIVDFSVDEVSGSQAHFVRSTEHHQKALHEFFARTGNQYERFNYLGEWHSHPSFEVKPSLEDIHSMQTLVEGERGIPFAALMIVKRSAFWRFECSVMLFKKGQSPSGVTLEIS